MNWNSWPFVAVVLCLTVTAVLLWLRRPRPSPDDEGSSARAWARLRVRRPGVIGYFWGLVTGLIVAMFANLALQKAPPTPPVAIPEAPQITMPEPASSLSAHQLPPTASDEPPRIDGLRASLEEDPSNRNERKQLALYLLSEGRFVEAFEEAETLLRSSPDDPDGLYIQGVVRLEMGQAGRAIDLLQRLLVDYPHHVGALVTLGRAQERAGLRSEAITTWQRGLEAAGGRHLELEALLGQTGTALPEVATANTFGLLRGTQRDEAASPDGYLVHVSLAPGTSPPNDATLFISARAPGGGPPVAVRRVDAATFPVQLLLGPQHSMTGQPLTATAQIHAKLDQDGNAFSVTPGDLSARKDGKLGEVVTLQLEN